MTYYLVQIATRSDRTLPLRDWQKVRAPSMSDAAFTVLQNRYDKRTLPRMVRVYVAEDRADNLHSNGMPIEVIPHRFEREPAEHIFFTKSEKESHV